MLCTLAYTRPENIFALSGALLLLLLHSHKFLSSICAVYSNGYKAKKPICIIRCFPVVVVAVTQNFFLVVFVLCTPVYTRPENLFALSGAFWRVFICYPVFFVTNVCVYIYIYIYIELLRINPRGRR